MCSEICPCYDRCANSFSVLCYGGRESYESLNASELAHYGRKHASMADTEDDLIPFVWSSDKSASFSIFTDCINWWRA